MNSETQEQAAIKPQNQTLVAADDPRLTLAANKLAGSTACLNCGTGLEGPFCFYCGQPDRNFMRFFPALLRDLLDDLLDLDSRFMRTLKPLLFKPGKLTRDYMIGRRFRYTPPMRLYIFSSIAFFLLATLLSNNVITVSGIVNPDDTGTPVQMSTENEIIAPLDALDNLPLDENKKAEIKQAIADSTAEEPTEEDFKLGDFSFNDEPWDRETNPVDVKWFPHWLNERINDEIEGSPKKAEQINANPNLIVDQVFDILPATMFVLLPVVALIFKFWYLFARRFYVEHLIFSLHNHAYIFVSVILLLLAVEAGDLFSNRGYTGAATGSEWFIAAISIWMPLYLLISLRVVYQQNWFLTIGKFIVIGISYVALLILITSGVAIASFVLL
jgi:hypothetical protein